MNTIERTEKIDAYLAGTMSDAEKKEFEGLLSDSETSLEDRNKLQNDMELQKEIIFAIRRRGFREQVKKEIKKIKEEKEDSDKRSSDKRRRQWLIGASSTGGLAAAAVVAFMITIAPLNRVMIAQSDNYAQSLQVTSITMVRGEETEGPAHDLQQAQMYVLENNWREADKLAKSVMQQTENSNIPNEKSIYEDAEWLHANCLMHRKRTFSAKRQLRTIAERGGKYSEQAKTILEKLEQ